jgi:hypothetical protein
VSNFKPLKECVIEDRIRYFVNGYAQLVDGPTAVSDLATVGGQMRAYGTNNYETSLLWKDGERHLLGAIDMAPSYIECNGVRYRFYIWVPSIIIVEQVGGSVATQQNDQLFFCSRCGTHLLNNLCEHDPIYRQPVKVSK